MAKYTSAYTGSQIDTAIGQANKIGNLGNLPTSEKDTIVGAITEIDTKKADISAIENGSVVANKAVSAKSLEVISDESGATQTAPFFFQATATANGTAETPTAPVFSLKSIKGNTIVYNMPVNTGDTSVDTISGHKYWTNIDGTVAIVTADGTAISVEDTDKVVDLTRWFNGSIPQAILDDPSVFPINYYDGALTYSAGELKNCSCTELKTVGFNQWDEEWEVGVYASDGTKQTISGAIRCKNRIPVLSETEYYFYADYNHYYGGFHIVCLDANGNAISEKSASKFYRVITTPTECKYIVFNSYSINPTSYSNDICINLHWDGERDGTYEPYTSHTYPLVWSGKSAGTVYDERLPDGTEITRIGSYTFNGNETWDWVESWGAFRCYAITNAKATAISASPANAIMTEYLPKNNYATIEGRIPYTFVLNPNAHTPNTFAVIDPNYSESDIDAFKSHIAGKTIYYELATPTTSEGTPYTSEIEGDDYGTMDFDSVVPVGNEFFYPADYSLLIDDLGNYTGYDVSKLMLKPATTPTADGTYTMKLTVSDGVPTISWVAD